jgi:NaMN:DMB phosphoribosyltransferase
VTALLDVGANVGWPDLDAAAAARAARTGAGRVAELVEWLAGIQGRFPPEPPRRPRCVVLGSASDGVTELAARYGVGLRTLDLASDAADAFAQGSELADREIDEGADLIVLAAQDGTAAPAVLASVLTGAEPVALLPRGAAAVDSEAWIAAARQLRDRRRAVAQLRSRPDELLGALASPEVAAAAGFSLRAAVRRTGLVLDGGAALAAALLCIDSQPRAREWWQLADTSADPAYARVAAQLERTPLLDLGAGSGDGSAGLLALEVLRAVAAMGVVDG